MTDPAVEQLVPVFTFFFYAIIAIGAGAAFLAGRAIAGTWRPWWQLLLYMPIQGGAVYFLHFALYQESLSTLYLHVQFYLIDTVACVVLGLLGFWVTRVGQMVTQYRWLNVRRRLLSWGRRAAEPSPDAIKSR